MIPYEALNYKINFYVGNFYRHYKEVLKFVKSNCSDYALFPAQDGTLICLNNEEDYTALRLKFK